MAVSSWSVTTGNEHLGTLCCEAMPDRFTCAPTSLPTPAPTLLPTLAPTQLNGTGPSPIPTPSPTLLPTIGCALGQYLADDVACVDCGKHRPHQQIHCLMACPMPTSPLHSPPSSSSCVIPATPTTHTAIGEYSTSRLATTCDVCPDGTYNNKVGQSTCSQCGEWGPASPTQKPHRRKSQPTLNPTPCPPECYHDLGSPREVLE